MTGISARHYAVLDGLRNQAAITREPKPLTPDGHEKWFSLDELDQADDLSGYLVASVEPAAHTLRKLGLVAARTQQSRTRYSITEAGLAELARIERDAGITEGVAANIAYAQAVYDVKRYQAAVQAAHQRANEALAELLRQRELLNVLSARDILDRAAKAGAR